MVNFALALIPLTGQFYVSTTNEEDMKEKRPVEMKPSICKAFIASYEEMMNRKVVYSKRNITTNYRMLIHYQVRSFAEYLQNPKVEYAPFAWEK